MQTMKPEPADNDATLSQVLREWSPAAELPPRFQEQVWQRLARAEAPGGVTLWAMFRRWLEVRVNRPAVALAYVTVLLGIGVSAGYWHARTDASQTERVLQARYVQAVDPFETPRP